MREQTTVSGVKIIEFMKKHQFKYSIVIPTLNHLEDCLKPCLESIFKNTDLEASNVEIIVVANGCTDGTHDYLQGTQVAVGSDRLKVLSFSQPLGYTKATNMGLKLTTGEFVVLMNNDCQVLDFAKKGEWLDMLASPFYITSDLLDKSVGVTGPSKLFSKETERHFVVFFLAMIRKELFDEIGYLDETFNPGGGEDIDFCARAENAGYKLVKVPEDDNLWKYETSYPIYHKGEATVHSDVEDWENKFNARMRTLADRNKKFMYSKFADVTCEISTKGRYFTTLPLAIMSVIEQEVKPKKLIVFQDDNPGDLRQNATYNNLFILLEKAGIEWAFLFGEGKGQVLNHQKVLTIAETEWIWRLDDDNFAKPDVLKKLLSNIGPKVGAIAGSVVEPGFFADNTALVSTQLPYIDVSLNMQWVIGEGVVAADHLYSSFIYRKEAAKHGYCMELSAVGHREETIFTHEMKRAGWTLLIDRSAVTWHLREPQGGIRSFNDANFWHHDEEIFKRKIKEWNMNLRGVKWINLDCGIGDHWVFRMVFDDILNKNKDSIFHIAAAHPSALEGIESDRVKIVSIAHGISVLGQKKMEELNIYAFCIAHNWNKSLGDAFKKLYE